MNNKIENIISDLSKVVEDMRSINCIKKSDSLHCSSSCFLMTSEGKCAYFETRNILNELVRLRK